MNGPSRQPDLAVKVKSPYKLKAGKRDQYVFFVFAITSFLKRLGSVDRTMPG
ncbi:MAG: hypothetical protein IPL01_05800 [Acidobacteria bacterium]|nr:hypothetical protein [Acidobacteriota bacterium]